MRTTREPSPQILRDAGFDEWREAVSSAFVPLDAIPLQGHGEPFRGALSSADLGELQMSGVIGSRARIRRSPITIRRSDPGVIKVALQVRGHSTVTQHGRVAALGPGDIAVYDTSHCYELSLNDSFEMLVAVVGRAAIRIGENELRDATARTIASSTGIGALLRPVLTSLDEQVRQPHSDATDNPLVTEAVADLVSAALRAATPNHLGSGETVLMSARSYIESTLGDITLSPAAVAAKHHISVRQLQKLFAHDGQTVSGFIRQRRLARSRRDLADPRQAHRSIGDIAASNGLVDAAHFSKLFKSTYGMSPREYRDRQ
ncbi:helix-turn-helix domain-containing protein [Gordonia otitidis]|uniref:AraC-like ligand-binding domain-containing protein n=1 Tax=Gordonia otitidis TaxID=249058 RepID=UPI001D15D758|nr:helix-turn-helix domain-containing protein [Gordonia otitidis]UEA60748.1 helix-turn-helix domain-containing protein [Gordonia otitidis]